MIEPEAAAVALLIFGSVILFAFLIEADSIEPEKRGDVSEGWLRKERER